MFASVLSKDKTLTHSVASNTTKLYLHLTMTSGYRSPKEAASSNAAKLTVVSGDSKMDFGEGDGCYMHVQSGGGQLEITSSGETPAEFLLFEISD